MGNQQSSGGGEVMGAATQSVGRIEDKVGDIDEITKVSAYLTDDGIKQLCGNPTTDFDKNECLIRYVNMRAAGRIALKLDPIDSDLTKKVPTTKDLLKKLLKNNMKATNGVTEVAVKTAEGYCSEGSVCGAPILGRPLWVWLLALFVILIAVYGLKHN